MKLASEEQRASMAECKRIARDHGLVFNNETIEYVLTNREFVDLRAKGMIPTLYDHWMDQLETEHGRREYEITRHNPFECVINTRPALSFYNDTNPEWLNRMIYYHVLGHIDFFQNNRHFAHTWNDDFRGKALADTRLIEELRREHGRWVDYTIEFARAVSHLGRPPQEEAKQEKPLGKTEFLFERFLVDKQRVDVDGLLNLLNTEGEERLFMKIHEQFPSFEQQYARVTREPKQPRADDVLEFIMENSDKLRREENRWMRDVIAIVRSTAQYFYPQMNTKIMNEGWASYWHETLFANDPICRGHEAEFAVINSHVVAHATAGLNPYALGLALFHHIEENANKGKDTRQYERLRLNDERRRFDLRTGRGRSRIFDVRREYNDFTFLNEFIDQEIVDKDRLYVVGERVPVGFGNTVEYYIKSRDAEDYKRMALNRLPHFPTIRVDVDRTKAKGVLNLEHTWEGEELHVESLCHALIGLEFLWGTQVNLRTRQYNPEEIAALAGEETDVVEFIKKDCETNPITWTCRGKKVAKNKGGER